MRVIILSFALFFLAVGQSDLKLRKKLFIQNSLNNHEKTSIENQEYEMNEKFIPISEISPYIVGGTEVSPPHKYPYLVALYIDQASVCGGVLISDEWVLSVAHCVISSGSSIIVEMGAHNISANEPTQVSDETFEYYVHPDYNPLTFSNDIALVRLPAPVTFTDAIRNISLPISSDLPLEEGVLVTITGWGTYEDAIRNISLPISSDLPLEEGVLVTITGWGTYEGKTSLIPYEATVSTISNSDCGFPGSLLCTSGDFGVGSCYPDAGGPVIYETANGPQLRGIIMSGGCGNGNPSVHTRVIYYIDWIKINTGII